MTEVILNPEAAFVTFAIPVIGLLTLAALGVVDSFRDSRKHKAFVRRIVLADRDDEA